MTSIEEEVRRVLDAVLRRHEHPPDRIEYVQSRDVPVRVVLAHDSNEVVWRWRVKNTVCLHVRDIPAVLASNVDMTDISRVLCLDATERLLATIVYNAQQ